MDYQTKVNATKEAAVKQLKDEFGQYSGFIFADYRGLTVSQISDLRKQLRSKDAVCRVVKNRYAKIAMRELGHEGVDDKMVGPTAIILARGDEQNAIAKIVVDAQKGTDNKLQVRGGYLDGKVFDAAQIDAFSKLPGRLELISHLMATMMAPVQKVAATLLAYQEKLAGNSPAEEAKTE
ncbi:MAG: 50S ribosomal protein L10 [Sphaerochaetaceae bacterium]|nr:50S ribosomal protein L10 [Sphaerochaetaceae bacterium]